MTRQSLWKSYNSMSELLTQWLSDHRQMLQSKRYYGTQLIDISKDGGVKSSVWLMKVQMALPGIALLSTALTKLQTWCEAALKSYVNGNRACSSDATIVDNNDPNSPKGILMDMRKMREMLRFSLPGQTGLSGINVIWQLLDNWKLIVWATYCATGGIRRVGNRITRMFVHNVECMFSRI